MPVNDDAQPDREPAANDKAELVKFTKTGGPLTKRIALKADGSLSIDGSACMMWQGTAERVTVANVVELAALIGSLLPTQALALGALRDGLPDTVEVTTKRRLNGAERPDLIARTSSNINYRNGPAFVLFDHDSKGMPPQVAAELARLGGFWEALVAVLPALRTVARVIRRSTSAGLFRGDTGAALRGSDGLHVYAGIADGRTVRALLQNLHERCWLAGLGWMMAGASGAVLERSIIDRMVWGAERLVFEGGPILLSPLQQDKESRRPVAVDGGLLTSLCAPLSIVEKARVEELKNQERERIAPECRKLRKVFTEAEVAKLVGRGKDEKAARRIVERLHEGMLHPDVVLIFDDPDLDGCTVGDVLADPSRFEGETLADPREGIGYGRCKAMIMVRDNGEPWIYSFAHGRTVYALRHNAAGLRKLLESVVEKHDVVGRLAELITTADLDAVELDGLRRLANKLSGVGLREIAATLKAAQAKQAGIDAKQKQSWQAAQRQDPRPQIRAPFETSPWLPEMAAINEVIGNVVSDAPPARGIGGGMLWVRKIPFLDMHVFTDANAQGDDDDDQAEVLS